MIYPQHTSSRNSSTKDGSENQFLPKKYVWYPNGKIESPMKQKFAESPVPKSISSYFKFKSVNVRNDPMTPQSQIDKTRGALTRKAGKEADTFGMASSAVKVSA